MRFTWRKLTLFGFAASIPFVALIARRIDQQRTILDIHREVLFACDKCDQLFPHFGVRFAQHLVNAHDISENDAIELVDDLYKKFKAAQFKRWEKL